MNNIDNIKELKFSDHYKKMWPFVKPYWFRAVFAVALSIPIGALDAVVALALKPFMDVVLVEKSVSAASYIPYMIVGFTIVQGILNYMATYMNAWVGAKITMDMKKALYRKLLGWIVLFMTGTIPVLSSSGLPVMPMPPAPA